MRPTISAWQERNGIHRRPYPGNLLGVVHALRGGGWGWQIHERDEDGPLETLGATQSLEAALKVCDAAAESVRWRRA